MPIVTQAKSTPFIDSVNLLKNAGDPTKTARFSLSGLTSGASRVYTLQDSSGTIAFTTDVSGLLASDNIWTGQNTFAIGTITTSKPFSISQTWNNAAVSFTGFKQNITVTTSAGYTDRIFDWQVGGVSKFWMRGTDYLSFFANGLGAFDTGIGFASSGVVLSTLYPNLCFGDNTNAFAGTAYTLFGREATDILRQVRGTNPQTLRIYGSYTDASNYSRVYIKDNGVAVYFGHERAGTSSTLPMVFDCSGQYSIFYFGGSSCWQLNSNSLMGFPTNSNDIGTATYSMKSGYFGTSVYSPVFGLSAGNGRLYFNESGDAYVYAGSSSLAHFVNANGFAVSSTVSIGFSSSTADAATADVRLYRDTSNVLALRNSTNAQTFRLYNTYTDASNYERGFMRWNSNVLQIGTEAAGTGTSRTTQLVGTTLCLGNVGAGQIIYLGSTSGPYIYMDGGGAIGELRDQYGNINFYWGGGAAYISANAGTASVNASANVALNPGTLVTFNGATSSYPALKRSSTELQVRLADDSAYAGLSSKYIQTPGSGDPTLMDIRVRYANMGLYSESPYYLHMCASDNSPAITLRGGGFYFNIGNAYSLSFGIYTSPTAYIYHEASDVLAMRRTTAAQTFRIYNTWTDASNGEWATVGWNTNVLQIGTNKNGTGSTRSISFIVGGTEGASLSTSGTFTAASLASNAHVSAGAAGAIYWATRSLIYSDASGQVRIVNAATTGFDSLLLGPSGTTYNRIKHGGTGLLQVRLADDSAPSSISFTVLVEANTATSGTPNVLTSAETTTLLTNEGASAENCHTLPTAAAGYVFEFVCQDGDGIKITAATGDTIRDVGTVSATAGYIRSSTVGSTLRLVSINATEWIVMSKMGTWTIDS